MSFTEMQVKFQLTRSRGAWQLKAEILRQGRNFNSHAHVERDETSSFYDGENKNFNSHAHVERDVCEQEIKGYFKDFNSHAHVERD